MEHADLHQQIVAILEDVFQVELPEPIDDLSQDELEEWDSFNHLRLVSELEDTFEITLDDEDIPEMISLQRVKALLLRHGVTSIPS